jgi:phosphate starvation-inducible PhoH-like protein
VLGRVQEAVISTAERFERTLTFDNTAALREVAGDFGAHLKLVSRAFQVEVQQRGSQIRVSGTDEVAVGQAVQALAGIGALAEEGQGLQATDVHHAIRALQADASANLHALFTDAVLHTADGRPITARTATQRAYVQAIRAHDIVFGVGPAGTGKTYLAVAMAVAALRRGDVRRIVLTRPAVEAGEKLGFLPGDLAEKIDPYLRPLFDALHDALTAERVQKMLEKRIIEIAPLAFMRGRTLSEAFILLDEGQNTTREQMKMFLTRLGHGARMVVTGDPSQVDLPNKRQSGLAHALDVLQGVPGVAVVPFGAADVVRHPVVAAVVQAYERAEAGDARSGGSP